MSTPSNLYAEKIFAEHPDTLWALDETVDYISLISEEQRNILNWNVYIDDEELTSSFSSHVSEDSGTVSAPFGSSIINKLIGSVPLGSTGQIVCISEDIINLQLLSQDMSNFAIGMSLYSVGPYIKSVEVGYEYYNTVTGLNVQNTKLYDFSVIQDWGFFSITQSFGISQKANRL